MVSPAIEGKAKCWDGCGGTILVKWKACSHWYAYCDRCGLVYNAEIIKARSDYQPVKQDA